MTAALRAGHPWASPDHHLRDCRAGRVASMRLRDRASTRRRWGVGDPCGGKLFGKLGLVAQRFQGLPQAFDFFQSGVGLGFLIKHRPFLPVLEGRGFQGGAEMTARWGQWRVRGPPQA